ncbi:MAG TPA: protein kinase, partial [Polyangiaceae bacterium]
RDLKPPNLFLTTRADGSSCVKVLDFGISKVTGLGSSSEQGLTSTAAIMGSPLYMSPEQLLSARDVDMRTDIWALGVICYELLSGKPPFLAETLPQLCMAISTAAPTPLRNYRPDVPAELEQLLARCLEKDRGKRVATVAELASELVKFAPRRSRLSAERIERLARAAGFSTSALALPPSSDGETVATTQPGAGTLAEFGRTKPAPSASKLRLPLVITGLVAAGAVGVFALRRPAPDPEANGAQPLPSSSTTAPPRPTATDTTPPPQLMRGITIQTLDSGVVPPAASAPMGAHSARAKLGTIKSGAQSVASKQVDPSKPANSNKSTNPEPKPLGTTVIVPSATTQAATPTPRSRL